MIRVALRLAAVLVAAACLLPTAGLAADLDAPSWRGSLTSTYQEWRFDTAATLALPETVSNPYGVPSAAIAIGDFATGWCYDELMLGTQTGYWDLGSAGNITVSLPSAPAAFQEIRVQVTYYWGIVPEPIVTIPGAEYIGSSAPAQVEKDVIGYWMHQTSTWRVAPGALQTIVVAADPMGGVIDHVIVDANAETVVPEPASLTALIMGCSALVFSRRRRS